MSATASKPARGDAGRSLPPARRATRERSGRGRALAGGVLTTSWVLLRVVLILACIAIIVAWRGFNVTPMAIVSGSMEPSIPTNSLIFVEEVAPAKVKVGDVITFDAPGPTPRVTHRVVERKMIDGAWFFTTRGDANDVNDDWRTDAAIERGVTYPGISYADRPALRKVWGVPHLGHIVKLTEHTALRMVLVFGSLAGILVLLLVRIWTSEEKRVEE